MIHVIAVITAKPGMREAVLREFRANMPAVHAEQGCIEYGPAIDAEGIGSFQTPFGPDTFVVVEKWESADALKAHAAAASHGRVCRPDAGHDRQPRRARPRPGGLRAGRSQWRRHHRSGLRADAGAGVSLPLVELVIWSDRAAPPALAQPLPWLGHISGNTAVPRAALWSGNQSLDRGVTPEPIASGASAWRCGRQP
jgi:quinol monooxygenase YgiN